LAPGAGFLMLAVNAVCAGIGAAIGAALGALVPFLIAGFLIGFGLGVRVVAKRFGAL
jgi:threonine/homoserine/homoserine lactone efflux protein